MVLRRDPERLHGDVFQGQQQFRFITQQQFDIGTSELDDHLRIFYLRIGGIAGFNFVFNVEIRIVQNDVKEILDAGTEGIYGVLGFGAVTFDQAFTSWKEFSWQGI